MYCCVNIFRSYKDKVFSILVLLSNTHDLKRIKGIEFTPREIDVLACILNNRGIKKTASLLSVAPSTAETHVRNIMLKTRSSSRDGIIDFVEQSEELKCLNTHYAYLISESLFIKALTKLEPLIPSQTTIHVDYKFLKKTEFPTFEKIIKYLTLSKVSITQSKSRDQNNLLCSLCPVSFDFLEEIKESLKEKEPHPLPVLYLNFAGEALTGVEEKSILNLKSFATVYDFIFALFKKIFPGINSKEIIETFTQEITSLASPSLTQKKNIASKFKQKKSSKKNFLGLFIWGLISASLLLFFFKSTLFEHSSIGQQNTVKAEQTWNLPPLIEHYTQRDDLTKAVWAQLQGQMNSKDSVVLGLYGLGGIGKTSLATHLIHKPKHTYAFRGWFSAENLSLLKASYIELGEKYNLFSSDTSEALKIKLVREWLESKESSLLIYDNAPNMAILKAYLPNKGHIIITSRNYKIQGAVEVDVMTETEAFTLLDQLIPESLKQAPDYKEEAKELLKDLGYLPLAISQSGSYINENSLTISNYRRLYETGYEKLLLEKNLPAGDQHESIYVTWDLNIKSIAASENGKKALDLLNFIATCHSENIPKKLLIHYLFGEITNETEIAFNQVLKKLRQHSLVKVSSHFVSIHRLVHEWVQLKQTRAEKLNTLEKSLMTIKSVYPYLINKSKSDMDFARYLQPHIKSILEKARPLFDDIKAVELIAALGDSYSTIGDYTKSFELSEQAFNIIKKHHGELHIKTAEAMRNYANDYHRLGQYDKSRALAEKALSIQEKHFGRDNIETIRTLIIIGKSYLFLGDYKKTKEIVNKHLKSALKNYGPDHLETSSAYHHSAIANAYFGNYKVAKSELEHVLKIRRKHFVEGHLEIATALLNVAWIELYLGDYDKALEVSKQAVDAQTRHYGPDHIMTTFTTHATGLAYLFKGDYAEAARVLENNLNLRQKTYGVNHIRSAYVVNSLGVLNCHLKDFQKAEQLFTQALSIVKSKFGKQHILALRASINLAAITRHFNDLSKCQILLEKALSDLQNSLSSHDLNVGVVMANLGLLYGDLGNKEQKKEYLEKALVIFKENLYPTHVYITQAMEELNNTGESSKSMGFFIIY